MKYLFIIVKEPSEKIVLSLKKNLKFGKITFGIIHKMEERLKPKPQIDKPSKNAREVLFFVSIFLEEGKKRKVVFRNGDKPEEVAFDFCAKNRLSIQYYDRVLGFLKAKLNEISNLEYSINYDLDREIPLEAQELEYGYESGQGEIPKPRLNRIPIKDRHPNDIPISKNNDLLKFYSQGGDNYPSTDRYLVEDICKSANDSIEHKLICLEEEEREPDVFSRLYNLSKKKAEKAVKTQDHETVYLSNLKSSKKNHSIDPNSNCNPRYSKCKSELRSTNHSPEIQKPQNVTQSFCFCSKPPDPELISPEEYYSNKLDVNNLLESHYQSEPYDTVKVKNEIKKQNYVYRRNPNEEQNAEPEKTVDIPKFEKLYHLSKKLEERKQMRVKSSEREHSFRPKINKSLGRSLDTSTFQERMEKDMKFRMDKERSIKEKSSREVIRKSMKPQTGRKPIFRKVKKLKLERNRYLH